MATVKIELWIDGDKREERPYGSDVLAVGDLVDVKDDGEIHPYIVKKLYKHFTVNGQMTLRANLEYAGPPSYGI